ncbi:unnamed protein product [Meloidogyne enterolobii]|uniref:Uncharacterized protein n=1 Tax=Meloidogyne enterolobii TaxID=390850 RepID=A0ACB0XLV0_MELEN
MSQLLYFLFFVIIYFRYFPFEKYATFENYAIQSNFINFILHLRIFKRKIPIC